MKGILSKIKYTGFLLFLLFVFMINIFVLFENKIEYFNKNKSVLNNYIIFLMAGIMVGILYYIFRYIKNQSENYSGKKIVLATLLLFCIQVFICYNIRYMESWDVGLIIHAAQTIANGGAIEDSYNTYFSVYPNNLFLIYLFANIFKFVGYFGIHDMKSYIMVLSVIQCFLSSMAGVCVFSLTKFFCKNIQYAWLSWGAYFILIGTSSWLVVPYSDSWGLIFPIFIIYLYVRIQNKEKINVWYPLLLVICCYVGYKIKPQIIIVLIAILIVECMKIIANPKQGKMFIMLICFFVGIAFAGDKLNDVVQHNMGFELNEEYEYGWTHFLMMGLNNERDGVWDGEDVTYSGSFDTKESRRDANMERVRERLHEYGITGVAKHLIKKMLVNFSDGTFFFGGEGDPLENYDIYPASISKKVQSVFWTDGNLYYINALVKQIVWIFILLCMLGNFFYIKEFSLIKDEMYVTMISFIGIFLFELLFEARSRYIFIYVPIIIVLGMCGIKRFFDVVNLKIHGDDL